MSTFLQMLRIAFWMLPVQRLLTIVGGGLLVAGLFTQLPFGMPASTLPGIFAGVLLLVIVPLLAGGVLLRQLCASRALLLRPRARGRLLAGALGILLLSTGLVVLAYWVAFLPAPVRYRPLPEGYLLIFAMTFTFGTQCVVSLFVASRSPAWTLVVLLGWQFPGLLLKAWGAADLPSLLGGPINFGISAFAWVVFGIWFLRVRRVSSSAWLRSDGRDATSVVHLRGPVTREQGMARWVLAGLAPWHIGALCFVAVLPVMALQWVFGREAGSPALHAMLFGVLGVLGLATGVVSRAMAARARALWLASGRSRLGMHAWMEVLMLRVALAVGAAVVLAALLAWALLHPPPSLPLAYLLPAVLAPGLAAAWLGLMQQHRRSLFDAFAVLAIIAGILFGLVRPLYLGSALPRWDLLAGELALAVLLREVAWVRWRGADWRRAQPA